MKITYIKYSNLDLNMDNMKSFNEYLGQSGSGESSIDVELRNFKILLELNEKCLTSIEEILKAATSNREMFQSIRDQYLTNIKNYRFWISRIS